MGLIGQGSLLLLGDQNWKLSIVHRPQAQRFAVLQAQIEAVSPCGPLQL